MAKVDVVDCKRLKTRNSEALKAIINLRVLFGNWGDIEFIATFFLIIIAPL